VAKYLIILVFLVSSCMSTKSQPTDLTKGMTKEEVVRFIGSPPDNETHAVSTDTIRVVYGDITLYFKDNRLLHGRYWIGKTSYPLPIKEESNVK
jgi:hypothetical protein